MSTKIVKKRKFAKFSRGTGQFEKKNKKKNVTKMMRVVGTYGLPERLQTKLKYNTHFAMSGSSGVIDTHTFRGNSLFDPDYTGTGHQPFSFDELSAVYKRYKVYACELTVEVANLLDTVPFMMIVLANTDSVAPTSSSEAQERPDSVHKMLTGKEGQGNARKISIYKTTAEIFGKKQIDDDDYQALISASPARAWYIHLVAQASNLASTWQGQAEVNITYYAQFFDKEVATTS